VRWVFTSTYSPILNTFTSGKEREKRKKRKKREMCGRGGEKKGRGEKRSAVPHSNPLLHQLCLTNKCLLRGRRGEKEKMEEKIL